MLSSGGSVRRLEGVALLHLGRGSEARERTAVTTDDLDDVTSGAALLRFFAGEIDEDSLWVVTNADAAEAEESRSRAHYYLGVAHLLGFDGAKRIAPDTTKAAKYFES